MSAMSCMVGHDQRIGVSLKILALCYSLGRIIFAHAGDVIQALSI